MRLHTFLVLSVLGTAAAWLAPSSTTSSTPLLACWSVSAARADEFHYRSILIGDRALGMGGAFTAIADDPSAAYYNPAGLALIGNSSVSASLQVNSIDRRTIDGAFLGVGNQRVDFKHSADPSVPIFVSLLKKFGPKDASGQQRHAFGLSTFHPDRRTLDYEISVSTLDDASGIRTVEDYRLHHSDETSWFGPSYAYAVSDDFAFGVSAFLSTRQMRHREEQSLVDVLTTSANPSDTSYFSVSESRVSLDARHIVLRFGTLMTLAPGLELGVMFQAPGIEISSDATVSANTLYANDPTPQYARSSQKLAATSPIPWELRVGGAYVHPDAELDLKVALDMSLHGPSGSSDDKVQALGSPQPDSVFVDYTPWMGNFLVQQYTRQLTFNVALGGEMTIAGVVPVRAGVFTNLSSAPEVPRATNEFVPDDVDQLGVSMSFGLRTAGYDLSLGGAAMFGSGHGQRLGLSGYERTDISDSTLVFFITGYRQALSRAARSAYQEL